MFQYPLCQTLYIEKYFDLQKYNPEEIQFHLGEVDNLEVTLQLVEKNKVLTRTLQNNYLAYEGPLIKISDLIAESHKQIQVIVRLSQNIKTEEDPESQCKNYPYENFINYLECDQTYLQNLLQQEIGITPFWATEDLENVTTMRQVLFPHNIKL